MYNQGRNVLGFVRLGWVLELGIGVRVDFYGLYGLGRGYIPGPYRGVPGGKDGILDGVEGFGFI